MLPLPPPGPLLLMLAPTPLADLAIRVVLLQQASPLRYPPSIILEKLARLGLDGIQFDIRLQLMTGLQRSHGISTTMQQITHTGFQSVGRV